MFCKKWWVICYHVVEVAGRSHVIVPYAFDTNAMRFMAAGTFVYAEDFARYCIDTFDTLWREGEQYPAMMSVGILQFFTQDYMRERVRPCYCHCERIGSLMSVSFSTAAATAALRPQTWVSTDMLGIPRLISSVAVTGNAGRWIQPARMGRPRRAI